MKSVDGLADRNASQACDRPRAIAVHVLCIGPAVASMRSPSRRGKQKNRAGKGSMEDSGCVLSGTGRPKWKFRLRIRSVYQDKEI